MLLYASKCTCGHFNIKKYSGVIPEPAYWKLLQSCVSHNSRSLWMIVLQWIPGQS